MNLMLWGFAIVGFLAIVLLGALIAALCCNVKDFHCSSYEEWKDGRIKPYSHRDELV